MTLINMIEADEIHPLYITHNKLRPKALKSSLRLTEIKRALRLMINHFLRTIIVPTLLTSSKLNKETMKQHLHRAREVYYFMNNLPFPS